MNICVFSRQTFWQGAKGGMEIHGKLLAEGLLRKGNSVSVISTKHPSGKIFEIRNGINIYYLKDTIFGSRRNGWKMESVAKFCELHKKTPFDIIWSQSFDAYGITFYKNKEINTPIVPILQGCIQQELVTFLVHFLSTCKQPHKILRSFVGLFFSYFIVQKRLLNCSDNIITASNQVKQDIKKWFGKEIAGKCVTIFNGVDTKRFSPKKEQRYKLRQKYQIKENDILLLSSGRLVQEKGHQLSIEILALIKKQHKNVKLMIVGDGPYRKELEKQVERKGLRRDVIFSGFIENDETPKYYNSSDIFLMPTLREEGLPFVLLELMACEKPVIVSKIGGNLSVVVDEKNGFYVPTGDVNELFKKTQLLIREQRLRHELALCARKTIVDNFSDEQMIIKTMNIMRNIAFKKD